MVLLASISRNQFRSVAVFKSDWWRYYTSTPRFNRIFFSIDAAQKKGRKNNYTVFGVWAIGKDHRRIYLLYVSCDKGEISRIAAAISGACAGLAADGGAIGNFAFRDFTGRHLDGEFFNSAI